MKALFSGSPSRLLERSAIVVERVHETCPSAYNASQLRFQRAIGFLAAGTSFR